MPYIELKNIENTDYFYQEAIKTLRTNLQFCGSSIKVIMFTSTMPSEGKSTTAFAAAVSMSRIRKKILFIDADIRKSVMVKTHEIAQKSVGLSQYLSGQATREELIYQTNVENLDLILAGPYSPNPAELLEEESFSNLLAWARNAYDYVFIDTPPMMNLIDGAIVARNSDGAVLLIDSGNISYRAAQRVKDQLEKSGCRILGTVLNRIGTKNSGGYYKKYYGKYYKKYDKYYENASERAGDEEKKTAFEPEMAGKAPMDHLEELDNGRKAGCSRKRRERM